MRKGQAVRALNDTAQWNTTVSAVYLLKETVAEYIRRRYSPLTEEEEKTLEEITTDAVHYDVRRFPFKVRKGDIIEDVFRSQCKDETYLLQFFYDFNPETRKTTSKSGRYVRKYMQKANELNRESDIHQAAAEFFRKRIQRIRRENGTDSDDTAAVMARTAKCRIYVEHYETSFFEDAYEWHIESLKGVWLCGGKVLLPDVSKRRFMVEMLYKKCRCIESDILEERSITYEQLKQEMLKRANQTPETSATPGLPGGDGMSE